MTLGKFLGGGAASVPSLIRNMVGFNDIQDFPVDLKI